MLFSSPSPSPPPRARLIHLHYPRYICWKKTFSFLFFSSFIPNSLLPIRECIEETEQTLRASQACELFFLYLLKFPLEMLHSHRFTRSGLRERIFLCPRQRIILPQNKGAAAEKKAKRNISRIALTIIPISRTHIRPLLFSLSVFPIRSLFMISLSALDFLLLVLLLLTSQASIFFEHFLLPSTIILSSYMETSCPAIYTGTLGIYQS